MAKKVRRPYKKPEVSGVELIPEEAVLANCKTVKTGSEGWRDQGCYYTSGTNVCWANSHIGS